MIGNTIGEIEGEFLKWLRSFYFVAQYRSFTKAGKEMGRNQPTINYQMNIFDFRFRSILGIEIFGDSHKAQGFNPNAEKSPNSFRQRFVFIRSIFKKKLSIG
jgi:hypothetical protein